jgi:hypothetical protein
MLHSHLDFFPDNCGIPVRDPKQKIEFSNHVYRPQSTVQLTVTVCRLSFLGAVKCSVGARYIYALCSALIYGYSITANDQLGDGGEGDKVRGVFCSN